MKHKKVSKLILKNAFYFFYFFGGFLGVIGAYSGKKCKDISFVFCWKFFQPFAFVSVVYTFVCVCIFCNISLKSQFSSIFVPNCCVLLAVFTKIEKQYFKRKLNKNFFFKNLSDKNIWYESSQRYRQVKRTIGC